ncbi:RibD family protein [Pseudalkalibacillus hwajinpoensis]|uniref:RibD family protein n=1 Tax=Guptibacillus hwajinpoensis TaxID=208199 RepID=UPI00325C257A
MKKRPEVVLNLFSSVDGRITMAPNHNVMEWTDKGVDGDANDLTHRLYDELNCDAMISGSESLIVWSEDWVELKNPITEPQKSQAYIVFDGRGRMNWSQTEGLIVVTRENVSEPYIEQLKKKGITYLVAGSGEYIDNGLALEQLYDHGFRRLGLSGGGSINGAFLRAGLIDEISIVLAPLAIGGRATPTVFDCEDLSSIQDACLA